MGGMERGQGRRENFQNPSNSRFRSSDRADEYLGKTSSLRWEENLSDMNVP